jgi:hypothetical protein
MVPDEALPYLAREGLRFQVEGPPKYEQAVPAVRDVTSAAVQCRQTSACVTRLDCE